MDALLEVEATPPIHDPEAEVHIWPQQPSPHALCGATSIVHTCYPYPIVGAYESACPQCGTPICPFCRLLLSLGGG